MTDKKLVIHISLSDGVLVTPASKRHLSIEQVINSWLARSALGYADSHDKWNLSKVIDQKGSGDFLTFE